MYRWPDAARDWLESGVDYGMSSIALLQSIFRDGLSSKMSPVCYPVAVVPLVEPCEDYLESIPISDVSAKSINRVLSALPVQDCLNLIEAATLPSYFEGWSNAGMASLGGYWTLSISEWPSAAAVCSLSEVLETEADWVGRGKGTATEFLAYLLKYSLSPSAAQGILRRAERRRKALPARLLTALQQIT